MGREGQKKRHGRDQSGGGGVPRYGGGSPLLWCRAREGGEGTRASSEVGHAT